VANRENKPKAKKMSEAKDMVTFQDIQRSYPPGEEMVVHYVIDPGSELQTSKRDWVGLFRVGWTSSRDYYTFEWATQPDADTKEGSVTFAGRRLPPEDGHFYQLCFVSRDGAVRGASAPFQFAPLSVSLDDMELVEVTDDSMKSIMILQKKPNKEEMESLRREVRAELGEVLTAAKAENEALAGENAGLRQQVEAANSAAQGQLVAQNTEVNALKEEIERARKETEEEKRKSAEKNARVVELEREVAIKCEAEQRLTEQVKREQARNQELLTAKESEEQEVKVLKGRVSAVEGELVEVTTEAEELRQQIRIKESQVDDLRRLVGTRGEELEQITEKLETAEARNAELHAVCAELRGRVQESQGEQLQQQSSLSADISAALSQKDEQIEKLEQELACTQANMVELVGARTNKSPQHAPPPPPNVVDKGAYVALQQAYENLEKYYSEEKERNVRALVQLKKFQEEYARLQSNHDIMVGRVKQCQAEYTAKAQECIELRRKLKKEGIPATTPAAQQEHGEMVQNCEKAAAELSIRRKECTDMQSKITALELELAEAKQRYIDLEDRHDRRMSEKNEEIQRQKMVFEEKAKEYAALLTERDRLKAKVAQLSECVKRSDKSSRSCPMCNMKFPLRMTEQDFEKHVNTHFEEETV
jgi:chromosome segregation ATPase